MRSTLLLASLAAFAACGGTAPADDPGAPPQPAPEASGDEATAPPAGDPDLMAETDQNHPYVVRIALPDGREERYELHLFSSQTSPFDLLRSIEVDHPELDPRFERPDGPAGRAVLVSVLGADASPGRWVAEVDGEPTEMLGRIDHPSYRPVEIVFRIEPAAGE